MAAAPAVGLTAMLCSNNSTASSTWPSLRRLVPCSNSSRARSSSVMCDRRSYGYRFSSRQPDCLKAAGSTLIATMRSRPWRDTPPPFRRRRADLSRITVFLFQPNRSSYGCSWLFTAGGERPKVTFVNSWRHFGPAGLVPGDPRELNTARTMKYRAMRTPLKGSWP